ncbi:MAG: hypothetical protein V8R85_06370 [Frisingicoccus sp.]
MIRAVPREEAAEYLRQTYKVSEEKIRLCTQVAANEKRILEGMDKERSFSLYIGIPFCPTICLYCSFSSYPLNVWAKEVDHYLEALFKEIRQVRSDGGQKLSDDGLHGRRNPDLFKWRTDGPAFIRAGRKF